MSVTRNVTVPVGRLTLSNAAAMARDPGADACPTIRRHSIPASHPACGERTRERSIVGSATTVPTPGTLRRRRSSVSSTMPDTAPTDAVVLARVALAGHHWSEALDLFAAAAQQGGLGPEDLTSLASAAWWSG